jgi:hypothetical protein
MKLRNFGYAAVIAVTAAAFVLGSAATGEAKSKKKTAAPPPPPLVFCTMEYKPVCAVKGGMKFTYSNACFAAKDGAKVVSQGACKPGKATKAGGKKKTAKAKAKPDKKK